MQEKSSHVAYYPVKAFKVNETSVKPKLCFDSVSELINYY